MKLTNEEKDQIISNLVAFLFKEIDAPCSAETHLSSALFIIIDALDEKQLNDLPIDGTGTDAIVENYFFNKYLGKNIFDKYHKFLESKKIINDASIFEVNKENQNNEESTLDILKEFGLIGCISAESDL